MTARGMVGVALLLATGAGVDAQTPRDRPVVPRVEITGTGVVAGVVVTADERQQPVRRVSVMLASGQIMTPRTAVTDDEGKFVFTAVAPGSYTLVGQKPAWVPAVYGARSATDTQGVPIAVADGQRVEGLRLSIMRGAVVSGMVRLAGGQPAADLSIQVMRVQMVDGRRQASSVAAPGQTNDLGAYRVFGLAPGEYVVQARSQTSIMPGNAVIRQVTDAEVRWADQRLAQSQDAMQASAGVALAPPTGPTVTYSAVYFPGTTFMSDATVLSLRAGEERGNVDFPLVLDPTARITGSVIGPDGEPSPGATVQLEAEGGASGDVMGLMMSLIGGSGRTTTRPDGTFTLSGVTPGRYTLTARGTPRRPGSAAAAPADAGMAEVMAMASAMSGLLGGGAENPATLWASETVGISGQDVGPLSLALRDGLTIEGTVVADEGGLPPDVVTLRVAVGKTTTGDPATAILARVLNSSTGTPKDDGTFVVRGLMPGRYQIAVTGKGMRMSLAPGLAPVQTGWVVKSIRWKEQDLADSGIEIHPDVPVTGVIVTLTNQPAQLGGTVIDGAGRPTGAFPIVVFSTDRAHWGQGSRRVVQAQPASDGKFTVVGLPAGEYYLAAVTRLEPGDLGNRQFLEDLTPSSLKISIRDGEKKTQDLKLSGGG